MKRRRSESVVHIKVISHPNRRVALLTEKDKVALNNGGNRDGNVPDAMERN